MKCAVTYCRRNAVYRVRWRYNNNHGRRHIVSLCQSCANADGNEIIGEIKPLPEEMKKRFREMAEQKRKAKPLLKDYTPEQLAAATDQIKGGDGDAARQADCWPWPFDASPAYLKYASLEQVGALMKYLPHGWCAVVTPEGWSIKPVFPKEVLYGLMRLLRCDTMKYVGDRIHTFLVDRRELLEQLTRRFTGTQIHDDRFITLAGKP